MLKLPSILGLTNEGFLNLLFPLFACSLDSIYIYLESKLLCIPMLRATSETFSCGNLRKILAISLS